MAKRLQVLVSEEEFEEIREAARKRRQAVSEWVRQTLRAARGKSAPTAAEIESKLWIIDRASRHSHPTADIEQMLAEIERGYLS